MLRARVYKATDPNKTYKAARLIPLERSRFTSSPNVAPPTENYFEIMNKSDEFCCVKLVKGGSYHFVESMLPSFVGLQPDSSLSTTLDPSIESIDLYILNRNRVLPIPDQIIPEDVFDSPDDIPDYGRTSLFEHVSVYHVPNVATKNVLLKFKGGSKGAVKLRDGKVIQKKFSFLASPQDNESGIDRETNAQEIKFIYGSAS
jgi:hypothetical protein